MRVMFVAGEYPPLQGGVGDYTHRLGQALRRLGVEVSVLASPAAATSAGGAGVSGAGVRRAAAGEDAVVGVLSQEAAEPAVYRVLTHKGWGLWSRVRQMIGELIPDVVHIQYQPAAYNLHPAVNYLPWRLRLDRRAGPAVFTTFHDLRVPYMFPKAGPLRWRAVLALAANSDRSVITNPEDWDHLLAARPDLAGCLAPLPIASNIQPTPPTGYDRMAQRARWGAGPDDWLLAYFAFVNPAKGGDTLIRMLGNLVTAGRPAHLLMVGGEVGSSDPTNQAYLAHIKALIEELRLGQRVRWTGFIPDQEVTADLLAADCAVQPYRAGASLRHGSLMAVLAHGLPIITTKEPDGDRISAAARAAFPRLQQAESVLLAPPEDPAALAAAVTQVMTDAGLRTRLSQGALTLARQFDWDMIARQHLQLYRQTLARPA